ncbi:MAG: hypothetical protein ACREMY_23755, partial [bacterium]
IPMESAFPRLREDVVIRRFDGDGQRPQFVAAIDDRHFLLSEASAALLEMTRRHTSLEGIARNMQLHFGRSFAAAELAATLRSKVPSILVRAEAGQDAASRLNLRLRLISAKALTPVLQMTRFLFSPLVGMFAVTAIVALDVLVLLNLWRNGIASAANASASGALLVILAGVVLHEVGHLSACRRFGAPHGGIGCGLYWCLPVLYAEVHGAWLLPRRQRAVVDLGGVYFQCVFLATVALAWLLHPSGTLLVALWTSHLLVFNTLNPVLKYDGYWLLSDLSGRHNLHSTIRQLANRSWQKLVGRSDSAWPALPDGLLLCLFVVLALFYFGYLIHFFANSLAFAASALQLEQRPWQLALRLTGLSMLAVAALGVS